MKFIFRGHTVFTYDPQLHKVVLERIHETVDAFNFCRMIPEDYMILGKFFNRCYLHTQDLIKTEDLRDIDVIDPRTWKDL